MPPGLSLNSTTGEISGTPIGPASNKSYTIIATNDGGNVNTIINIIINDKPPNVNYQMNNVTTIYEATSISFYGVQTGTGIFNYSILPTLPTNLSLNTTTGEISGIPNNSQQNTSYIITASNTGNSINKEINILIKDTPPSVEYNDTNSVISPFFIGDDINILPNNQQGTGIMLYTIIPALTNGISLNATTGEISGTISGIINDNAIIKSYTITATNIGHSVTGYFTLRIYNQQVIFNYNYISNNEVYETVKTWYNSNRTIESLAPNMTQVRKYYDFHGWSLTEGINQPLIDLSLFNPDENTITLYAQWGNIIVDIYDDFYNQYENKFKPNEITDKIDINLVDIETSLISNNEEELYTSYINELNNKNQVFNSAKNTKNNILTVLLSKIVLANNDNDNINNLDILINKNILPDVTTSMFRTEKIKLISALSSTLNNLNLIQTTNFDIQKLRNDFNSDNQSVLVTMENNDEILFTELGVPILYIRKNNDDFYYVKELNGEIITTKTENIKYKITSFPGYIFEYMLGSVSLAITILPPPPPFIPPIKHTQPLAFRISHLVKIENTSRNAGITKFYNAKTKSNCSNSKIKNNFN